MAELGFSPLEISTMASLKRCKPTLVCATQWSESEPPGVCSDLSDLVTCLRPGWWMEWVSSPCIWCPWFSGQACCFSWEQRLLSLLSNDAPTVWEAERIDLPNLQVRWPPVKVPFHAQVHWQCYYKSAVSGTCYDVTMLRPSACSLYEVCPVLSTAF